ncbi:MAG: pantetheine-phosphate adenylyltransferase [Nitrososphaerota archaeon]|jgi:pantetheine-phosphate adenylyltransferase|uniref:phosphopantetheine adenylyltransferase n=1 Tax=Candidatus Bathycorpusculum sp. TaxID=2994959 RepID=UPI00282343E6|nr:pantetheine-phosphate adenylyltransferase [Candidatus Termitimicrobium sp.]MCL2432634.1 pantetheine-phosphate adenylyltransferase [Candidatus Termitimicrobium sp.]MDR0493257.1 pantetheine-phosphate adenylyltransferase [Nitrososphaerota archaeon]
MKPYKKVAVGGTFDELHSGHKALLNCAFEVGEQVVIGLTSDAFVMQISKPHKTASYTERCQRLEAYLAQMGLVGRVQIVPLTDSYGLMLSARDIEALIVSEETQKIGKVINQKRRDAGYPSIQLVVVDMVPAQNHRPISTTRIRRGEIDHNGRMLPGLSKC